MGHSDSSPHMESTSVVCKLLRVTYRFTNSFFAKFSKTQEVIQTFNLIYYI